MASSTLSPVDHNGEDADLSEQAIILQQQLVYNGEILDLALDSLRAYRPGTQSLKYLDASVGFAWALIRMVERMNKRNASGVAALVRQKKVKKRKKKNKEGAFVVPISVRPHSAPVGKFVIKRIRLVVSKITYNFLGARARRERLLGHKIYFCDQRSLRLASFHSRRLD
jgi:hypothetical protein